ncbi:hypothetical protein Psal006b_01367 [Piscirickettsia salmonis]|uniref:Uncharacterized protein n=1 Tax=Piscirickettsia salmonis TaxID=1238 RepID=A0A1L6TCD4_PISSA|nr:hypothetical protein [Piscirickettsia salmonis]AKP74145.1 hypothetical protein PSLF89_2472 [Piscirickettsia salmonis LF-89 = ATCC VR-1361]ALB23021.1 hypothetical protein KU39_1841 [Piscirickettsia salmonis]ALY02963.1 hypothetical protein AWE47_09000 [Piscirickettsia salmonis]AMA42519.1 hypothetical protein AWJ11_09210 [Piscirickettsia salmonis]AOS34989.1 hypothetical protein AVM72_06350 [Piscirickettsia salmonis]
MPVIKRKAIFSLFILAVLSYIFTTAYVEHIAEQTTKRLIQRIKLDTPAILSINYAKLTASPLTLYNNTVAIKNIVIVFKDQPNNPLIIGQLSLISAKLTPQHELKYLKLAFEDVHFSQKFHYKNLPAALLHYGFFHQLANYLNNKSPYFYSRFSYDANSQHAELINQITLDGANYYRSQERLTHFHFQHSHNTSNINTLLSDFLHGAAASQLEQYSVTVRIPNFTPPAMLQKSLFHYIDRTIDNSEFIGQFDLYKSNETNQFTFRRGDQELINASIRQVYPAPPRFSYGQPPALNPNNNGRLILAKVTFPALESEPKQTPVQKTHLKQTQTLINALVPEKSKAHYNQALVNLISGQHTVAMQFQPQQETISAYQFYRLLAHLGRLALQYPNQPQATLPQFKETLTPWLQDIEVDISH